MPRPEKDYALAFRKDIEKLDRSIESLYEKRSHLVKALEAYTGVPYAKQAPGAGEDKGKKRVRNRSRVT